MSKSTDLIQMETAEDAAEEPFNLQISSEFLESFDLKVFLKQYVLADSFRPTDKGKENVVISDYKQLLDVIVNKWKAKKYIGVGVGGVYICKEINKRKKEDEYVLLYKRYHEPENQLWSILGGSSVFENTIEETLKDKISAITHIDRDAIIVKDIIKANNHRQRSGEATFHYLSPSYYIDITNPASKLVWGNRTLSEGKIHVDIIDSLSDFDEIGESRKDDIPLAWVLVDLITNAATASDGKPLFAFTTLEALNSHQTIRKTAEQMTAQMNVATKQISLTVDTISSYKDWRINNGR